MRKRLDRAKGPIFPRSSTCQARGESWGEDSSSTRWSTLVHWGKTDRSETQARTDSRGASKSWTTSILIVATSSALVDDSMSRRPHELLGSIVSAGVALAEGPPKQWPCGIEEAAQTAIVFHRGRIAARRGIVDDRVTRRLLRRNGFGSETIFAVQVREQLWNRQVGDALATKRSAVVSRSRDRIRIRCRFDSTSRAGLARWLGRLSCSRMNENWSGHEQAGHTFASIDEVPSDRGAHRECMSLAHHAMGIARPGQVCPVRGPRVQPYLEGPASLAVSVDHSNWRRTSRAFTCSAHAVKLVAPTACGGFIATMMA
ncbi:MAG: hypothetical protein RLZ37_1315 [Actinomycetota bacterium]